MYLEALYDDDEREVTITDYNTNSIIYKYDDNLRLCIKETEDSNTVYFDIQMRVCKKLSIKTVQQAMIMMTFTD